MLGDFRLDQVVAQKIGQTNEDVEAARKEALARVDARCKAGGAAVDAVRYVLSDRCPGVGVQLAAPLYASGLVCGPIAPTSWILTLTNAGACYDPGSAKHHAVKNGVLHRARDTENA